MFPVAGAVLLTFFMGIASAAASGPPRPSSLTERLSKLMISWASLAAEPTIQEVQDAIRRAGERQLDTWHVGRSGWAHALPTRLSVRVQEWQGTDWSGTRWEDDGWRTRSSSDTTLSWRLEAEWDLSRLVWDPRRSTLLRRIAEHRRRLATDVDLATRLYFDRRRAQLEYLRTSGLVLARRLVLWARISELTARIDAMTGGLLRRRDIRWWLPSSASAPALRPRRSGPQEVAAPTSRP